MYTSHRKKIRSTKEASRTTFQFSFCRLRPQGLLYPLTLDPTRARSEEVGPDFREINFNAVSRVLVPVLKFEPPGPAPYICMESSHTCIAVRNISPLNSLSIFKP